MKVALDIQLAEEKKFVKISCIGAKLWPFL